MIQKDYLMFENWSETGKGPHLYIPECKLNIISIFDDLRYDRSDADILSPAMRRHIKKKLESQGFKQNSGNVFQHREENVRCIMPKAHALGSSPFHITDYTPKQEQDFYILTPTQTACQFVNLYPLEHALEKIGLLIERQPINLFRLKDYLEDSQSHRDFAQAIPHIKYLQRMALESPKLRQMRALRW